MAIVITRGWTDTISTAPDPATWEEIRADQARREAEQDRIRLKAKIKAKHSNMTVWRLPMLNKRIDRLKLHAFWFIAYSVCAAGIAVVLTGVFWAWRAFFVSALTTFN